MVFVRRDPRCLSEHAEQMKPAEAGQGCEIVERYAVAEVRLQVVSDEAHSGPSHLVRSALRRSTQLRNKSSTHWASRDCCSSALTSSRTARNSPSAAS